MSAADFETYLQNLSATKAARREVLRPDVPLILLGAGSRLAQSYVDYALANLNVRAMVDNARAGQVVDGVPVVGDEGLKAILAEGFSGVGVFCCGSEGAIRHFRSQWQSDCPLVFYFEALSYLPEGAGYGPMLGFLPAFAEVDLIKRINASVRDAFADAESVRVLEGILKYRLTWDMTHIEAVARAEKAIYFEPGVLEIGTDEVFVDGGAYDGDTVRAFAQRTGGRYAHIHAFELDPANVDKAHAGTAGLDGVTVHAAGLWSHADTLSLEHSETDGSRISDRPESGAAGLKVPLVALDAVIDHATLIKLDVEGAEAAALEGARRIITNHKPKLAVCAYHRPDDLIVLVDKIKALRPDYRLRLRHYSPLLFDTVIYAD